MPGMLGGGGGGMPPMGGGMGPQTPAGPAQGPGGTRPVLSQILMTGLDKPQGEQITFVFADGFKSTNTFRELFSYGVDAKALQNAALVIEDAADKVHGVNRGLPPTPGMMR